MHNDQLQEVNSILISYVFQILRPPQQASVFFHQTRLRLEVLLPILKVKYYLKLVFQYLDAEFLQRLFFHHEAHPDKLEQQRRWRLE